MVRGKAFEPVERDFRGRRTKTEVERGRVEVDSAAKRGWSFSGQPGPAIVTPRGGAPRPQTYPFAVSPDQRRVSYTGVEGKKPGRAEVAFRHIPTGIPGLGTRLPLLYSEGVLAGRITLQKFVELTSTNPAKAYGLHPRKGTIAVGSDADLVLWDEYDLTLRNGQLHHAVDYTPYEGMQLKAWPALTLATANAGPGLRGGVAPRGRQVDIDIRARARRGVAAGAQGVGLDATRGVDAQVAAGAGVAAQHVPAGRGQVDIATAIRTASAMRGVRQAIASPRTAAKPLIAITVGGAATSARPASTIPARAATTMR